MHKDPRLPVLMDRIRECGKKTMIITNSEFEYTNKIMEYLTDFPETKGRKWTSYFDFVVVDAKKPLFFEEGTILRKVNTTSGKLSIGHHMGKLEQHCAYSGGSCEVISQMIGAQGKDVLYVGDHIFGDILRSKKQRGWRTFLVVPELSTEVHVWTDQSELFNKIKSLEQTLSIIYKNLDSSNMEKPDISNVQRAMMDTVHELDLSYGMLGSLFRSGSRLTFFSSQVQRFADIYAASVINLIHYPFTYMFRAPAMLLPHESTVSHENTIPADDFTIARQRSVNNENKYAKVQHVAHLVQRHPQRSLITMTTMTLRRPVVTAVTNQPDHIDGATTAQQKGGRAETKTYMNNSRRMTSVQFYHNATEKGRAQTKLTWTSILLIISLFSLYVKKCFTMLVFWTLFL